MSYNTTLSAHSSYKSFGSPFYFSSLVIYQPPYTHTRYERDMWEDVPTQLKRSCQQQQQQQQLLLLLFSAYALFFFSPLSERFFVPLFTFFFLGTFFFSFFSPFPLHLVQPQQRLLRPVPLQNQVGATVGARRSSLNETIPPNPPLLFIKKRGRVLPTAIII